MFRKLNSQEGVNLRYIHRIGEDEVSNSEEWKADAGEICKSPVEILKDRLIANNKELLLESLTQIRLISTTIQQGRQRLHRYC